MSLREKMAQRRQAREAQRSRVGERAREVRGQVRAQASALCVAPGKATPGTFSRLYASRDEALQVFEDAEGHLTSVNAARFA
ncbi:MAG TPA: hypothetical protein IAC28_03170 [Candidatus Aphodovivens excrementavium]|nr:hypothetical protein [Candidatus Aphodovivens excrementavium]